MDATPGNLVFVLDPEYHVMMNYAQQHPYHEVIGVFFGTIGHQGEICVRKAFPFRIGAIDEVEFTDDDYERLYPIIKQCELDGLKWLGWFHSHPFKGGDHIYMSHKDVNYQRPAQQQNPFWTAIVINPHQTRDPNTTQGMRAYRLKWKTGKARPSRRIQEIPLQVGTQCPFTE
jgi:proteasome lid subunit RPN8/RPN11